MFSNIDSVVVSQPGSDNSWNSGTSFIYTDGPISVRNLTDTPEDCAIAGNLMIEAFRGKCVHATSERSIPKLKECTGKALQGQLPVFYERIFVAEYDGQIAGTLTVKFHGDPKQKDRGEYNSLGCCDLLGLMCIHVAIEELEEDVPAGKCYLDQISVDDKFRGKGIGKVLMGVAENEARRKGCNTIYLLVTTTNRARNLYERQGYTIEATKSWCYCCLWCPTGERAFYRMDKTLA